MLRKSRCGAGGDRGAGASPASNAANPPAAGAGAGVASISTISVPTSPCVSLVCCCQSSPVFLRLLCVEGLLWMGSQDVLSTAQIPMQMCTANRGSRREPRIFLEDPRFSEVSPGQK